MSHGRIALGALSTGLGLLAGGANAQSPAANPPAGACFEIVAPQRHAEPASPILFDKCTGRTWLLVRDDGGARRSRRSAYQWVVLATEDEPPRAARSDAARPAASPAAAPAGAGGQKCFEFSGQRYCE